MQLQLTIMVNIDYHVLIITFIFMLFDFGTGFLKAIFKNNIQSVKMREGLMHKTSYVLMILLAIFCEYAFNYIDIDINIPMTYATCMIICATEIYSIYENIHEIMPNDVKNKFDKIIDTDKTDELPIIDDTNPL